jgi:hypothetical protein
MFHAEQQAIAEGYAVAQWLSHSATSRKIKDSTPDGVKECFQFTKSFQPH